MDNRTSMLLFIGLVVLFAFTFVFCLDALFDPERQVRGNRASIGCLVCMGFALFKRALLKKDGAPMTLWFTTYSIVVGIVFVWYPTRCGTAFAWW